MRRHIYAAMSFVFLLPMCPSAAQRSAETPDPLRSLVSRLDLERYKATIKALTVFGDRREGTDRNRAAIDWIESQLKSYGCTNTERITYNFQPRPAAPRAAGAPALGGPSFCAQTLQGNTNATTLTHTRRMNFPRSRVHDEAHRVSSTSNA